MKSEKHSPPRQRRTRSKSVSKAQVLGEPRDDNEKPPVGGANTVIAGLEALERSVQRQGRSQFTSHVSLTISRALSPHSVAP